MTRDSQDSKRNHAVIIGGSMAGLLAARALCPHFERVTILERDAVSDEPEARKGQPQARHTHVLLVKGLEVLSRYFPDLVTELTAGGAVLGDLGNDLRWYAFGGYRLQHESGIPILFVSRPFLEWHVRRALLAEATITLRDQVAVQGVTTTGDRTRVTGVQVAERTGDSARNRTSGTVDADLVVDTTGRGSILPRWLSELGYPAPPVTTVQIDVGYATRLYRRRDEAIDGAQAVLISPQPPDRNGLGLVFPLENGRWIVGLGGWGGEHPPTDAAGFVEFARNLVAPDVYDFLQRAEPLSEIVPYKIASNAWHRYEQLRQFPAGLLVLGDAFCCFNPVYGQGMTSAALQAAALDRLLAEGASPEALWRSFFKRAATLVSTPWQLAVGEDFRFPKTQGRKPLGTDLLNAYGARVHRLTHRDAFAYEQFARVFNMTQSPASLLRPKLLWRSIVG